MICSRIFNFKGEVHDNCNRTLDKHVQNTNHRGTLCATRALSVRQPGLTNCVPSPPSSLQTAMIAFYIAMTQAAVLTAAPAAKPHIVFALVDDWGSYDVAWREEELGTCTRCSCGCCFVTPISSVYRVDDVAAASLTCVRRSYPTTHFPVLTRVSCLGVHVQGARHS